MGTSTVEPLLVASVASQAWKVSCVHVVGPLCRVRAWGSGGECMRDISAGKKPRPHASLASVITTCHRPILSGQSWEMRVGERRDLDLSQGLRRTVFALSTEGRSKPRKDTFMPQAFHKLKCCFVLFCFLTHGEKETTECERVKAILNGIFTLELWSSQH